MKRNITIISIGVVGAVLIAVSFMFSMGCGTERNKNDRNDSQPEAKSVPFEGDDTPSYDYRLAEQSRKAGKHFAAITDYNRAIKKKPKYENAYYGRGLSRYQLGEYSAALADFDNVIRLNSKNVDAYIQRGWTKYRLPLIDILNLERHQYQNLNDILEANTIQMKNQTQAAIMDFDTAIRIKPDAWRAHYSRGVMKYQLKQYWAAISDFDTAIRINDNNAYPYYYRGLAKQHFVAKNNILTHINLEAKQDWQTALKIAKRNGNKELQNDIKSCLSGFWSSK